MNDDYLWDGSGEPDPETERLEQLLAPFRYEPQELNLALRQPRASFFRVVAIAAIIVISLAAALWLTLFRNDSISQPPTVAESGPRPVQKEQGDQQAVNSKRSSESPTPIEQQESREITTHTADRRDRTNTRRQVREALFMANADIDTPEPVTTTYLNPFFNLETAKHVEKVQLFLRSFRNARISESEPTLDIAYEKHRARDLLTRNSRLRLDAELKGNLPVVDLLTSIEPYLLDIANLPNQPPSDNVSSIQDLIQRKEIIASLQVYSAPGGPGS